MPALTIHTATYNRGYILEKAYRSLCAQTVKDFEWLISDDGSTDNTEELVRSWMEADNGFPIHYKKLDHVHIPRALNSGVERASTPWFMMLDSDDYILPQTVEKVLLWLEEVRDLDHIAGIGFARCYPEGRYMKDQTPLIDPAVGYVDASHIERERYNLNMDMCEVHRTELFRKYPFQRWPDELYAPEQLNFNEMALDGWKLRWHDEKLYICEYLPDGQTRDDRLVKNNPMGFAMMHNQNLLIKRDFRARFHAAAQMIALCTYAGHPEYLKCSNSKAMTALALPYGLALSVRRKKQYAKLT